VLDRVAEVIVRQQDVAVVRVQDEQPFAQDVAHLLEALLREYLEPFLHGLPLPELLEETELLDFVKLVSLLDPLLEGHELHRNRVLVLGDSPRRQRKVVFNSSVRNAVVRNQLHIIVVVGFLLYHVSELQRGQLLLPAH
jgi:hypothetical protein